MVVFIAILFFVGVLSFSYVYWSTNNERRATLVLVLMPLFSISYSLLISIYGITFLLAPITFLLYFLIPLISGAAFGYFLAMATKKKSS